MNYWLIKHAPWLAKYGPWAGVVLLAITNTNEWYRWIALIPIAGFGVRGYFSEDRYS